jgi:hypothetical protein
MTENQWLTEKRHTQGMLWCLKSAGKVTRTKLGKRKLRLYACGCCRLIWDQLQDRRLRDAVEIAERFAEGQATKEELEAAHSNTGELWVGGLERDAPGVQQRTAACLARDTLKVNAFSAAFYMTVYPVPLAGCFETARGETLLCNLIRCVFGNPFRAPPAINRNWVEWNNGIIRKLAASIYQERRFQELGVLADALSDAGCDNEEILGHCRQLGADHCRGCWVLDLLRSNE